MKRLWVGGLLLCALLSTACVAHAASSWFGKWIWNPPDAGNDGWFRRAFEVTAAPQSARIAVTADNAYDVYLNGEEVGRDDDWTTVEVYDVTDRLKTGRNLLAAHVANPDGVGGGLLLELAIIYAPGKFALVTSDGDWKWSGAEQPRWFEAGFDDGAWGQPRVIGRPPREPWGDAPEHPDLIGTPLRARVENLRWLTPPKPGGNCAVSFDIVPETTIPGSGPIGLRLLRRDEAWWTFLPEGESDAWPALVEGKRATVTIPDFHIPNFAFLGESPVEVAIAGVKVTGEAAVTIGQPPPKPVVPEVGVERLTAEQDADGLHVRGIVRTDVAFPREENIVVRLWRGDELWWHHDAAPDRPTTAWKPREWATLEVRMPLPPVPDGRYRVTLSAYRSRWSGAAAEIEIRGVRDPVPKPMGYGTFEDRYGVPHPWYINHAAALIWDGEPYLPVGGMNAGAPWVGRRDEAAWAAEVKTLATLKAAGVRDQYIGPRWGTKPHWPMERLHEEMDAMGFRYGWQLTRHLTPLDAWQVLPSGYLPDLAVDVIRSGRYHVIVKNGFFAKTRPEMRVAVAFFDLPTGKLFKYEFAQVTPVENGVRAEIAVAVPRGAQWRLKFIPEMRFNPNSDMHDYWAALDGEMERQVREWFAGLKPGSGMRLFLDPLDNEQHWRDANSMVPASAPFKEQFAAWLADKYGDLAALEKAWALNDHVDSIAEAAGLVPAGKPPSDANAGWCLNFDTNKIVSLDLRRSHYWYDLIEFRDHSVAEFNCKFADWIKSGVNVPVVQKFTGSDFFANPHPVGGFDGLGMEAYGSTYELYRGAGAGMWSQIAQSARTLWSLTTETGVAENDFISYPSPLATLYELGAMAEAGGKGVFVFVFIPYGGGWDIYNFFRDPRQLYWLGAFRELMEQSAALPDYRPPIEFSFPGPIWGQEAFRQLLPDFHGTTPETAIHGARGSWVAPVRTIPPVGRLLVNLEDAPATERWGAQIERALADGREVTVIGLRANPSGLSPSGQALGALPSIDRYYTADLAVDNDYHAVQILNLPHDAEVLARTADGRPWFARIGTLIIWAKDDWPWGVRSLAAPAPQRDFVRDVLGANILDLGPGFQAFTAGEITYVWNISPEPGEIIVTGAAGTTVDAAGVTATGRPNQFRAALPGSAERPAIIRRGGQVRAPAPPEISENDAINLAFAEARLQSLYEAADKQGVAVPRVNWFQAPTWPEVMDAVRQVEAAFNRGRRHIEVPRVDRIVVDGELSDWAGVEPVPPVMKLGHKQREEFLPAEFKDVLFWAGWDEDYLFFAAQVRDDKIFNPYRIADLWMGDCLEIMIDMAPPQKDPKPSAYDAHCNQFLFSPTNADGQPDMARLHNPTHPEDERPLGTHFAAKPTADGYVIEAAIPTWVLGGYNWTDQPRAYKRIGLAFAVDDVDPGRQASGADGPEKDSRVQYVWGLGIDPANRRGDMGTARLQPITETISGVGALPPPKEAEK